ncbi:MAG: acyl--CoA ligase [Cyanobacteria bacterium SZAS-4]|nr:acyl--CoA ligase [Cyanobacteria bacterium SZAS-4]
MTNESAEQVETTDSNYSSSPCEVGIKTNRLTQDEVLRRLFSPTGNSPKPRDGKSVVVVTEGGAERAVTQRQIESLIRHGVEQLKKLGVKEGDRVIFYCENSPEYTSTILACWSLNAMATLLDYRAPRHDVLSAAKRIGAKLLVTSQKLYVDYKNETKVFSDAGLELLNVSPFAELKESGLNSQFDIQALDLDRPAFAILTSGTTGAPKTVVHNLRSLVLNIVDLLEYANLPDGLTALTPLPISHIFGLSIFMITQVLGAKTVLTQLEPVGFVKAVHRHKPDLVAALPQFYGALLSAPKGFINLSNAKLLLCGGAPLTVSLSDKFEETFGKRLNNGYGSTESKLVAFNVDSSALSIGKPVGNIKVDIVNERNEVLPEGKIGEVRITGSMFMDGYLDNEEASKKVLHDGHYYTGDIGRYQNNNLFVIGRKGDVIIVGGVVVEAGVVEEALRSSHDVKDVAVTAMQNKRLGQIIKASVVLVDDKIADKLKSTDRKESLEAQLQLERHFREFCKEHLTRFQRPMKWEFLASHDSLPKTLAGKTDKKAMTGAKSVS